MTLLIHPGFHKTGTTWLQQQFFADSRHFAMLFDHVEIDRLFIRPHDLEFDAQAAAHAVAARRAERPDTGIAVISSETLTGQLFTGARMSKVIADRLAQSCGGAKILLTVRAQRPITRSIYVQYLKRGGRLSIDEFLGYEPEPSYGWFNAGVLQFGRVAQHYADLFGPDAVLVLPQELLARDRKAYAGHIFRHATGADLPDDLAVDDRPREGVSPPASGMWLLRTANLFRAGPLSPNAVTSLSGVGQLLHRAAYRWTWGEKAAHKQLMDSISAHMAGKFGASNTVLQQYCPVDLRALGYEMD